MFTVTRCSQSKHLANNGAASSFELGQKYGMGTLLQDYGTHQPVKTLTAEAG